MLTLALAATLIGFVLLVLGLITGTVWLAISCIVVCLVGLGFLIADVIGGRREREERTLADFVDVDESAGGPGDPGAGGRSSAEPEPARPGRETAGGRIDAGGAGADAPGVVDPGADVAGETRGRHGRADLPPPPPPAPPQPGPAPGRDGTYDDYLRSVGGYPPPPPGSRPPRPPAPPPAGYGSSQRRGDDAVTESLPVQPPSAETQSAEPPRRESTPPDEPPKQRFDPLDPNWRPPLD
ncbi:hypothetical protein V1Y59_08760 [Gordonia sp. PKS22-38]|uniref:Uncharacterized protein n=1 Tax=Gordonia prachuapensis TaxID=3115651 RepID=A0ABU7MS60_9ACTN|nr:hypothetical protein [Gordonia sp. PKS22-38]